MAPAVATHSSLNVPSKTRYPAKGMMSSEGSGMQADSIAIRMAMPPYPVTAMTDLMKTKRMARSFSVIHFTLFRHWKNVAWEQRRDLFQCSGYLRRERYSS